MALKVKSDSDVIAQLKRTYGNPDAIESQQTVFNFCNQ